jgi:hypothetical protein
MRPTPSAIAAGFAACLLVAAGATAQTQPIGYVKVAQGEIRVMRGGAPELLRVGDPVYSRDRIVTLDNQAIGITLADNSRVSAGQNTVLVMQEFRFNPESRDYGMVVELLRGTLSFISGLITKLAPETVRIDTPTATVAVRGTQILVRAED